MVFVWMCMFFASVMVARERRGCSAFKDVRITSSVQSQIKCLAAEDPRSFVSRGTTKERKKKNLHLKQDKSLCFYPFNVVAPVSHWLINETQESSSGTEECQPKAFDPLTFIRCAPAKMPKSDPCLHAFNGPRRALLTVLPFSEGQLRNCTAEPWKPSEPHPRSSPQQSGNIVTLKQEAY